MKSFLPKASTALTTTILTATLTLSPVARADESVYEYNPTAELTTKFSKGRNIGELNYMQPFLANDNHLPILDLKLKLDNQKSKEINLGLVYRYNYDDKAILGTYAYFDHRRTGSNFSINGLNAGVEVLSKYIDARANIYIPQNKRKKLAHNSKKSVEIKGTSIFAISGGHKYESALRGYDIEVGTPLFAFSDSLNETFGTKVYAARYSFTAKNVKPIVGTRFRIEQDLGKIWAGDNSYKFHVSAETQFDKVRKRQNFIGLGVKVAFNDKKNSYKKKQSGLRHRMMETVIRDVDIVTESVTEAPTAHNFYMGGKEIKKIYYVGSASGGYSGDGTKENPMSLEQMNSVNCDNAVIVVTSIDPGKGGTAISRHDYAKIKEMPQVLNGKENVVLSTTGADKVSIAVNGENGISITAADKQNTKIIVENNQISKIGPKSSGKASTIQLLEPETTQTVETQIETARVEYQAASDLQELIINTAQTEISEMQQEMPASDRDVLNQTVQNIDEEIVNQILDEAPQEEELALQPQGTFKSGVDRSALSPAQQALYDLITNCAVTLKTDNIANNYVIRQAQYDKVAGIIQANPGTALDDIKVLIQNDITIVDKDIHKGLAEKIMTFDGTVGANVDGLGGQQGIGTGHTGPKDITSAASLEKLRATYGILDGDKALELAQKIVIRVVKDNIPAIGHDIAGISLGHRDTAATPEYKAAAKLYLDNVRPPLAGETPQEKVTREGRKNTATATIKKEIKSSLTSVNNNMAAYRALYRAESAPGQVFTEEVLGRYNDKEMLAYAILANLDVKEIQKNLQIAGKPLTPSNIWASQQENIQGLIVQLGRGQRAYNMDHNYGTIDIGGIGGLYPPVGEDGHQVNRSLNDDISCAHGYCVRIVDSMQHHSLVNLSDASPASFANEFLNAVKQKTDLLNPQQQDSIGNWCDNLEDAEVTTTFNGDRSVTFSTPAHDAQVDLPIHYKTILTDVAAEMDSRYNYANPNHKLQLVKKNAAKDVFKYTQFLNLGF